MKEEKKDVNLNLKSETIDKVVDKLAVPVYADLAHKPFQSVGDMANTVISFVHNFLFFPMQKYNIYAQDKLDKYGQELERRAKSVPEENLVQPRVNILGPTVDGLKYNLDEEYIKEMFTNILISEIDDRKQNKVLPAYIEIVKQLSKDDAQLLKFFKDYYNRNYPIMKLKTKYTNEEGYIYISNNVLLITDDTMTDEWINSVIIDNLLRLKLIDITFSEHVVNTEVYSNAFKKVGFSPMKDGEELDYAKGLLKITDFGQNFIEICLL